MKKILIFVLLFFVFALNNSTAGNPQKRESKKERTERLTQQAINSMAQKNPEIFFYRVPKLNVKDKIFVVNKSSSYIVQAAFALIKDDGSIYQVGSAAGMAPGQTLEIASYEKKELKYFPKRVLAVKIKGTKKPYDGFNMPEMTESDYRYDFYIRINEKSHDMYIEIINKGGGNFDF